MIRYIWGTLVQKGPIVTPPEVSAAGLLFIGDAHLSSRPVEYRKDDYGRAILRKLEWGLAYARKEDLVPIILGDLFHYPRDNANWLLVELIRLFTPGKGEPPVLAVYGNHDTKENALGDSDTFSVLVESGHLKLLESKRLWRATVAGVPVALGGSHWSEALPKRIEEAIGGHIFWVAHHNLGFPGYDAKRIDCHEIPGVTGVINGHIHRRLPSVTTGCTTWLNPGALARVARGDATRDHHPALLRIDITADAWKPTLVDVPCEPYDNVFHPIGTGGAPRAAASGFIAGLRELEAIRTSGGVALKDFLANNIEQFEAPVQAAIWKLASEVTEL